MLQTKRKALDEGYYHKNSITWPHTWIVVIFNVPSKDMKQICSSSLQV